MLGKYHRASSLIHRAHFLSWNWHSSLQIKENVVLLSQYFFPLIFIRSQSHFPPLEHILKIGRFLWEMLQMIDILILTFLLRIKLFHKAPISTTERTVFIYLTKMCFTAWPSFQRYAFSLLKYWYSDCKIEIFRILSKRQVWVYIIHISYPLNFKYFFNNYMSHYILRILNF